MGNQITLTLRDFKKFDTNIPAANKPSGPLVNVSDIESGAYNPYTVTVLAYLPGDQVLKPVELGDDVVNSISLDNNLIYLTYYGVEVVTVTDRNQNRQLVDCRKFCVEYDCNDEAQVYDLYYIQFDYQLNPKTLPVDAILVKDKDDDPETDRGTVTMPETDKQ
ncbi:hypothetical protein [Tenacibaculum amylolyticum]|uniref:hypothetical protein n=1 Tax=Tenacibaculum amylolyticum TaxID=104269 RepID=UPI003892F240